MTDRATAADIDEYIAASAPAGAIHPAEDPIDDPEGGARS